MARLRRWTNTTLTSLLAFGLLTAPAAAQDPQPAKEDESERRGAAEETAEIEDQVWHERMVVTATRSEIAAGSIPLFASVIEPLEIEAVPARGMLEVLRQVSSLNTSRDTGHLVAQPRDQAISFRGLVASVQSRALPLVDGFPIADPYGGSLNLGLAPKELIDRVDVVRGGGSSAWGNLALSGVVNMITRNPGTRRFQAGASFGQKATVDLNLQYADTGERWSGWVAANYFDTDGYIVGVDEDRGPIDEPKFRSYESLHGRLGYTLSDRTVANLRSTIFREDRGQGTALDRDRASDDLVALAVDHLRPGGSSWEMRLFHREVDLDDHEGDPNDDRTELQPDGHILALPVRSIGLGAIWSSGGERHRLSVGADAQNISMRRREIVDWDGDRFVGLYRAQGRQRMFGAFAQDHVSLSERTSLQLGVRIDRVRSFDASSVLTSRDTGEVLNQHPIGEGTQDAFNPSFGFVHASNPSTRIRGAVYTGFRHGTPSELFIGTSSSGRSVTVPNPSLEPETLLGGEVGFDYTPSRELALRLTVFRNEVDDLIQRLVIGTVGSAGGVVEPCGDLPRRGRCVQRRNLGKIRSTGLEIGADYRPSQRWRWTLDAALMRSRIVSYPDDRSLEGNQVERAPDHQVALSVELHDPRFGRLHLRGRYVGDAYDDAENEEFLPAHTLVDLSWSRQVKDGWELYLGVENLFDRRYLNRWSSSMNEQSGPRLAHVGFRFRPGGGR
jgi:outer membrane receptor protein involved in Fe transport